MITLVLIQNMPSPGMQTVKVVEDGKILGQIYVASRDTVRIEGIHLLGAGTEDGIAPYVVIDDGKQRVPPIPFVSAAFAFGPYEITDDNVLIKHQPPPPPPPQK